MRGWYSVVSKLFVFFKNIFDEFKDVLRVAFLNADLGSNQSQKTKDFFQNLKTVFPNIKNPLVPSTFKARELNFLSLSFYDRVINGLAFLISFALKVFKNVIIPLVAAFVFFIYCLVIFKFTILKVVGGWLIVLLFAYWLLSGFNFFLKRYRYGKFTSSLQRF